LASTLSLAYHTNKSLNVGASAHQRYTKRWTDR
jgi:hypothetical protein